MILVVSSNPSDSKILYEKVVALIKTELRAGLQSQGSWAQAELNALPQNTKQESIKEKDSAGSMSC